jgi:hypothetical protein
LTFETGSGLTGIGLPTSQDSMKPEMIMMSRETTRMTSEIGNTPAMPSARRSTRSAPCRPKRIEECAEFACHVEALGEEAVDRVADPGCKEKKESGTRISPDVIAQTTIGTRMMRPKVMRFGILKRLPRALRSTI